jgi:hypothetical protein
MARAPSVVALLLGCAVVGAPAVASAFCRSTTCKGDCATDDDGCNTTGMPLFWKTACVGYSMQKNGTQNLPFDEVRVAVTKSFFAWTELDCGAAGRSSLTFSALPDVACKRSEYKSDGANVNVVLFRDDEWTYRGIDGTLAKTTVTFDAKTGEILDADIEINAAFNNLTVRDTTVSYDLQSIMTHEIGHMIGFAHSPDPTATMFSSYDPGTIGIRTLSPDDVAAVCTVYPPGRAAVCNATPRGGLGDTCPAPEEDKKGCAVSNRGTFDAGHGSGGAWLVAGSLLAFAGARRLRRRSHR